MQPYQAYIHKLKKAQLVTRLLFVLHLVLFSCFSLAAEYNKEQTSTLSSLEVKETTQNIVVALEQIYLYPERSEYISKTLLSESFGGGNNSGYDTDTYLRKTRSRIVQATLDTSIDLLEEPGRVKYSSSGEPLLNDLNGTVATEISEDNVGYLKIAGNSDFDEAKELLRQSIKTLVSVDALIIDIRLAERADLSLIRELLSYFLKEGTAIGTITTNGNVENMSIQHSDGYDKFKEIVPLYILTSSFVNEEWEFFSYSLQQLNRAFIIGETTMGVALLNKAVKVGNNIVIDLPYARLTQSTTGDNWEEIGVIPDHEVSQREALNKAYKLALTKVKQ